MTQRADALHQWECAIASGHSTNEKNSESFYRDEFPVIQTFPMLRLKEHYYLSISRSLGRLHSHSSLMSVMTSPFFPAIAGCALCIVCSSSQYSSMSNGIAMFLGSRRSIEWDPSESLHFSRPLRFLSFSSIICKQNHVRVSEGNGILNWMEFNQKRHSASWLGGKIGETE